MVKTCHHLQLAELPLVSKQYYYISQIPSLLQYQVVTMLYSHP